MKTFLEISGGIAGIVLLYYGAEFLIRGGIGIARKLHIPELIVGLTLVAFGTSAPEFVVSLSAGVTGKGDIAIGNIVGSNICNIALILGLCALIRPLSVNPRLFRMDLPIMTVSTLLLAVFLFFFRGVDRLQAVIFLLMMAGFIAWQFFSAKKNREDAAALAEELEESAGNKTYSAIALVLMVAGGLFGLVAGARLFVTGAVSAARFLGVPEAVIALSLVALGTSLPELATSLVAALKKQGDIAVGNVVGSNIFNVLFILGIAPLVHPISARGISHADCAVMVLVTVLVVPFMWTRKRISRIEGALLLAVYIAYIVLLAFGQGAAPRG
ncbi:MAG: calcium/sodium antiporter [Lentisphaeria bacterium]|nr:calcium/sodium antiporter [Lentisphaeria bacterium]